MNYVNQHIVEVILSNPDMTANNLLEYLGIDKKLRCNFLVGSVMNGFFKVIEDYDISWREI